MRNRTMKIGFIIIIIFIILSGLTNIILHRNYTRRVNEVVLNIIGVVRNEYPNVNEEELLSILNNENIYPHGLEMYGIRVDDIGMLRNIRSAQNMLIVTNIVITLFLAIAFATLLLIYMKQRRNKVDEITEYIREINRKNYCLKLDENDEDELSILQNELYKITVVLKEQSENAIKDKINVKDSLSDISHQLKTPLTSVMIGLDNLTDSETMDVGTRQEFLSDMKKQIEHINFLISSILKLSKLDSNVIKFDKQEINVRELLTDVLKNLENIRRSKDVEIEINGENDIAFVRRL